MPITKERQHLYSDDWKEISKRVRREAGQECETCAAPNRIQIIRRADSGTYARVTCEEGDPSGLSATWFDEAGQQIKRQIPNSWLSQDDEDLPRGYSWTKIVLTVAHLDQDPGNNERWNLKALCQRCHLKLDSTRQARMRRAELEHGQQNMFGGE